MAISRCQVARRCGGCTGSGRERRVRRWPGSRVVTAASGRIASPTPVRRRASKSHRDSGVGPHHASHLGPSGSLVVRARCYVGPGVRHRWRSLARVSWRGRALSGRRDQPSGYSRAAECDRALSLGLTRSRFGSHQCGTTSFGASRSDPAGSPGRCAELLSEDVSCAQ